jgi:WD40 repeat protein
MMFGYVGGVLVALATVDLVVRGWTYGDPFVSRYALNGWFGSLLLQSFVYWAAALLPFTLVRSRLRDLRTIQRCVGAGVATFLLTHLLTFFPVAWLIHFFSEHALAADVINFLFVGIVLAPIGGAAGGLAFWAIERRYSLGRLEPFLRALADGSAPLAPLARQSLRRMVPEIVVTVLAIACIVLVVPRWLAPHVSWWSLNSSTAGMPRVDLLRELPIRGQAADPAFSPDGARLAVYSNGQSKVVVWNNDGEIIGEPRTQDAETSLVAPLFVSGGGQIVILGGNAQNIAFSVLDATTGAVVHEEPAPDQAGVARGLAMSPDGSVLVVAFYNGRVPIALYATGSWSPLRQFDGLPGGSMIMADDLSFDRDGKRLAIGLTGDIIVVDAATGNVVQRLSSAPGKLALSPDGSLIAVARGFDHEVSVLRVADGKKVASYATDDFIYDVEWDPLGRFLAFETFDVLHLWNPFGPGRNEATIRLRGGGGGSGLALTRDGSRLAVANGGDVSIFGIAPP